MIVTRRRFGFGVRETGRGTIRRAPTPLRSRSAAGIGERGMMTEVIRFALLGLGVGALYAFASQGLIVIYRGTGVLNFALGATAIAGVFMQWELQNEHG